MRTKKLKSRLSRKVIRGGALFSFGAKYTSVFTCDSQNAEKKKMCEGMNRVAAAITDEKSYPTKIEHSDRKNMYAYFEHSGSIKLLETVAEKGSVNSQDVAKYKVILKILKSIFYSKGYYEEVEVLRNLEKKTTILPAEQTKIKDYRKNLSSILMSYEELYNKIIAMEKDLKDRKANITGVTEEQKQKEIDSKEQNLIDLNKRAQEAKAAIRSVPSEAASGKNKELPTSEASANSKATNPLIEDTKAAPAKGTSSLGMTGIQAPSSGSLADAIKGITTAMSTA